ncbi:MAG TPA: hypothetical protein VN515_07250 [Terriglobales bacterium]|nr:hypothetical protein [Terriglobales bacterium]
MDHDSVATKLLVGAALAIAFALTFSAASSAQVTERSFTLGATPLITVDNVSGPIDVVGDGGSAVRLTATETNPDNATNVHLDITQSSDSVKLYVDGPFRCGSDHSTGRCDHWGDNWDDASSRVRFAFELHVPAGSRLDLRTVNHGDVTVRNVGGAFTIRNVNGAIKLDGLGAAGSATTVNGSLSAAFRSNPGGNCDFGSVNGSVSLYFQPGLNADLTYKTLNGSVYSDFAVSPRAMPTSSSRDGNMIVFRRGRESAGRIGSGGAQLNLHTVNGSIYVHQQK